MYKGFRAGESAVLLNNGSVGLDDFKNYNVVKYLYNNNLMNIIIITIKITDYNISFFFHSF